MLILEYLDYSCTTVASLTHKGNFSRLDHQLRPKCVLHFMCAAFYTVMYSCVPVDDIIALAIDGDQHKAQLSICQSSRISEASTINGVFELHQMLFLCFRGTSIEWTLNRLCRNQIRVGWHFI